MPRGETAGGVAGVEAAGRRVLKVPDGGDIGPEPGEGRRQVVCGAHRSVAPRERREKRKLGGVSFRQTRKIPSIVKGLIPIGVEHIFVSIERWSYERSTEIERSPKIFYAATRGFRETLSKFSPNLAKHQDAAQTLSNMSLHSPSRDRDRESRDLPEAEAGAG